MLSSEISGYGMLLTGSFALITEKMIRDGGRWCQPDISCLERCTVRKVSKGDGGGCANI